MDPALKEELEMSQLLDVPGLVEYLFPDQSLPIPFPALSTIAMRDLYDANEGRWESCPDLSVYSLTDREEKALAAFLNNFGEKLAYICVSERELPQCSQRKWHSQQSSVPLPGGPNAKRKPDFVLAEKDDIVSWTKTMVHLELRSGFSDKNAGTAFNQLVNGAYMVFSSQGGRRFHIGVSFCRYDVRVYVFDRAGVVGSMPIKMHSQPDTFVRLMAGLMFADPSLLGYDPTIVRRPGNRRFITVDGKKYEIIEAVFISDSIRGRGTVCWRVRRDGIEYVVKDLWADISGGHTEADILKRAEGIEGVAQIVAEEIVQVGGENDTTARIRAIIDRRKYSRAKWLDELETRVHRRIVMTPFAVGLTHFSTKKELVSVFIDAIATHRRLVEKGILHRDISLHNVMIYQPIPSSDTEKAGAQCCDGEPVGGTQYKDGKAGLRRGFIIDLDYAIFMEEEDRDVATGHRTGTLPFMAIDMLLGGKKHEPRHDLESFFYVLLWICWNYAGPKNTGRRNFDIMATGVRDWIYSDDFEETGTAKFEKMTASGAAFKRGSLKLFAPYFEDLKVCVTKLRDLIFHDYGEQDISHQGVIDILKETLKTLPDEEDWSWEDDKEGYGRKSVAGKKRKFEQDMPTIREENEGEQQPRGIGSKRARTLDVKRPVKSSQTKVPDYRSERTQRPPR
ncbi:hypothetical protein GALMADRAFT_140084 [Galerina marginata CBS 339.88]|uniref:Fungal-type protein kinase domain-containing protein n=1 Tax=Galerina marginata (strain CBS 339.88) TaxID=685588 RepID=A0A067T8Z9_GALM3|nr:hypothetical protein GALMADRAFT_140084 [Galerina marginata CBS 339.88]